MTSRLLNIHEIKSRFSHYAREVMKGKSFILAIRNRPFAELRPLPGTSRPRIVFGVLRGKFTVPDDFNEPLEDFSASYYD
jgi:antitoxin (DNA-binding transcriptional repressor) of toxin-antitoxin stability system